MTTQPLPYASDPIRNAGFAVEVDGLHQALFRECSGLNGQVAVTTVEEGGSPVPHQLPGRVTFGNLTLKQGVADSNDLYEWFLKTGSGRGERKNVTVRLLALDMSPVRSWTLVDAFPVRWNGPSVQAGATDVAVESLELAHEGILA
jgi:phage tail-like protein